MVFLKQSLNVAAYEAAREAIRNGRGNADATAMAENILDSRQIVGATIEFPRGESLLLRRGEELIVEVSAPSGPNSPLVGQFIANRLVTARVVMLKQ